MTWQEMKYFCDSLDEKQLQSKVLVWREDECISALVPITLEEDNYVLDDADGCVPESEALYIMNLEPQEYPNGLSDVKKAYDKGHPILMEDF